MTTMSTPPKELFIQDCSPFLDAVCKEDKIVEESQVKLTVEETGNGVMSVLLIPDYQHLYDTVYCKATFVMTNVSEPHTSLDDISFESDNVSVDLMQEPYSLLKMHRAVLGLIPNFKEVEKWSRVGSQRKVDKRTEDIASYSSACSVSVRDTNPSDPTAASQNPGHNDAVLPRSPTANSTTARLDSTIPSNTSDSPSFDFYRRSQPVKELSGMEDIMEQVSQTEENNEVELVDSGLGTDVTSQSLEEKNL